MAEAIGKVISKIGATKILEGVEAIVRARNWSGLAELVSSLLEKLSSGEAVAVLGEVGGAAARKKFLRALAFEMCPVPGAWRS